MARNFLKSLFELERFFAIPLLALSAHHQRMAQTRCQVYISPAEYETPLVLLTFRKTLARIAVSWNRRAKLLDTGVYTKVNLFGY